jgi:hypothetical protein
VTWLIAFICMIGACALAELFKLPRWLAVSIGWLFATLSLMLQSHYWACHP